MIHYVVIERIIDPQSETVIGVFVNEDEARKRAFELRCHRADAFNRRRQDQFDSGESCGPRCSEAAFTNDFRIQKVES